MTHTKAAVITLSVGYCNNALEEIFVRDIKGTTHQGLRKAFIAVVKSLPGYKGHKEIKNTDLFIGYYCRLNDGCCVQVYTMGYKNFKK